MDASIYSLSGKNIIVTGASSGIGRAVAIICSNFGANVALLGRDEEKLQAVKAELKQGNHHILAIDLVSPEFNTLFTEFLQNFDKIDGFVHSAGAELTKSLSISSEENFIQNFNLNVLKGFMIAKTISNKKYLAPSASYVFISSVMSIVGQPGKIIYATSKGAMVSGVRAMALELAAKQVRVNAVSPGMVDTPMSRKMLNVLPEESRIQINNAHPLGIGKPEDVAQTVHFLLSNASTWITGMNMVVDGGYTVK